MSDVKKNYASAIDNLSIEQKEAITEGIDATKSTEEIIADLQKTLGVPINDKAFPVTQNMMVEDTEEDKDYMGIYKFSQSVLPDLIAVHTQAHYEMIAAKVMCSSGEDEFVLDNLPEGQVPISVNEVEDYGKLIKNKLLTSKINIRVHPLSADEMEPITSVQKQTGQGDEGDQVDDDGDSMVPDIPKYEFVQYFLEGVKRRNDFKNFKSQLLDDLVIKGTGIALIEYDEKLRVGQISKDGAGEVRFRTIDPNKFYPDPNAKSADCSDMDYFFISNVITGSQLKSHPNYPDIAAYMKELYPDGNYGNLAPFYNHRSSIAEQANYMNFNFIILWTLYRRVWHPIEKRYYVLFSEFLGNDCSIVLRENVPIKIETLPIAIFKTDMNSQTIFSKSTLQKVMPLQHIENYLYSLLINYVASAVNPMLGISATSGISLDEGMKIQASSKGAIVMLDKENIQSQLAYIGKEVDPQLVSFVDSMNKKIQNKMQISNLDQGQPGSVQTSEAMNIVSTNSDNSLQDLLNNYAIFEANLLRLVLKTAIAHYDERSIFLKEMNPNSETDFMSINYTPDMLMGCDFSFVIEGDILTDTAWQQKQQQLINLFTQQKTMGFDNNEVISIDELIEIIDPPNKEAAKLRLLKDRPTIASKRTQVLNLIMQQRDWVWSVVNNIYKVLNKHNNNNGTGQAIMPFTPINALPQQLQSQVMAQVMTLFSENPDLAQRVNMQAIPFLLNQEQLDDYIFNMMQINSASQLDQEMQTFMPQPQNIANAQQQGGGQSSQPKPSGAMAQQPAQQAAAQGSQNVKADAQNMQ